MAAINARCAASGQTIADGDACRLVLISQSASFEPIELDSDKGPLTQVGLANSDVYPNCNWRPQTAFLKAVYDDYGMLNLVLGNGLDRALAVSGLETLRNDALRTLKGKNAYHDLAFDLPAFIEANAPGLHALLAPRTWMSPVLVLPDDSLDKELQRCWSHVCDLVRRHRVFMNGYCRQVRPVELHLVHEQAYQGLARHLDGARNWNDESLALEACLRRALAAAHAELEARRAERLANPEGRSAEELERDSGMDGWYFKQAFGAVMNRLDVESCFSPDNVARRLLDHAVDMLHEGRLDEARFLERAFTLSRDRSVICAMERLELKFTPVTYVTGDSRNTVGAAYAAFVADIARAVSGERTARG